MDPTYSKRAPGLWRPIIAKAPLRRPTCGYQVLGEFSRGGLGGAGWGVITQACEARACEGNEVRRMLLSRRVVPPFTLTPIPLRLCPRLLTRVAPVPNRSQRLDNRMDFSWRREGGGTPESGAHPGRSSQAGSQSCFQAFHHITSDQKQ